MNRPVKNVTEEIYQWQSVFVSAERVFQTNNGTFTIKTSEHTCFEVGLSDGYKSKCQCCIYELDQL